MSKQVGSLDNAACEVCYKTHPTFCLDPRSIEYHIHVVKSAFGKHALPSNLVQFVVANEGEKNFSVFVWVTYLFLMQLCSVTLIRGEIRPNTSNLLCKTVGIAAMAVFCLSRIVLVPHRRVFHSTRSRCQTLFLPIWSYTSFRLIHSRKARTSLSHSANSCSYPGKSS